MLRKDGSLKAATWEETLSAVTDKMKASKGKIAAIASTRLSTEALDAFKQVCKAAGAASIASTEEGKNIGAAGNLVENDLDALKAADAFLVVGEDLTKDHQVLSFFIRDIFPTCLQPG